MKGIILAGRSGKRLHSLTLAPLSLEEYEIENVNAEYLTKNHYGEYLLNITTY